MDWEKEAWIFSDKERRIIDFKVIDKIARHYDAKLVLLIGANLKLSDKVKENHDITYSNYQISSISILQEEDYSFLTNAHFNYLAHSYNIQQNTKNALWLPTGIFVDFTERVVSGYGDKLVKNNLLLLWNSSYRAKYKARMSLHDKLKAIDIDFTLYGNIFGKKFQVNAYKGYEVTYFSKFLLDHNSDAIDQPAMQLSARFFLGVGCLSPVITCSCIDIERCFDKATDYLSISFNQKGFSDRIKKILSIEEDRLNNMALSAYNRAKQDHDWSTRWAKIIYDCLQR